MLNTKNSDPKLSFFSLNVRVLLLVRDPRGTMESRNHRDWCPGNPDCEDPAKLCSDLVSILQNFFTIVNYVCRIFVSSFMKETFLTLTSRSYLVQLYFTLVKMFVNLGLGSIS
jgi:hypothetical protein